ncbi:MAG: heavy metal sensor histidine kinase [Rhodocyclaceae bacterium]
MRRPLSLTVRLTILFAIVTGLSLGALGGVTMWVLERHFAVQDQDLLSERSRLIENLIARTGPQASTDTLRNSLNDAFGGHGELSIAVTTLDGRPLFAHDAHPLPAQAVTEALAQGRSQMVQWEADGRQWRGIAARVASQTEPLLVLVAIDIGLHTDFIRSFGKALAAYVIIVAVAGSGLGWLAVRRGLLPLKAMKERASKVTVRQLDVRMAVDAMPVEMAEFASTLNQMLARLEDAFRRLSDFSSDIAHELRTPLSNLMTQTQVALNQVRTPEQYRDVLASNAEELERLARMVSDMLFLAKADHGLMLPSVEDIDLAREVAALCEFYEALAEDRQVGIHQRGHARIRGDRLMIRRAIGNLLSNALRYTPPGGAIDVAIETDGRSVRLAMSNPGPAIPVDELRHVFDRFYRAEKDRAHAEGDGTGLGLAITQAIAQAHGGSVSASSDAGLTRFVLAFPRKD